MRSNMMVWRCEGCKSCCSRSAQIGKDQHSGRVLSVGDPVRCRESNGRDRPITVKFSLKLARGQIDDVELQIVAAGDTLLLASFHGDFPNIIGVDGHGRLQSEGRGGGGGRGVDTEIRFPDGGQKQRVLLDPRHVPVIKKSKTRSKAKIVPYEGMDCMTSRGCGQWIK